MRSRLAICVATMQPKPDQMNLTEHCPGDTPSWLVNAVEFYPRLYVCYNTPTDNLGVVGSYQWLYENSEEEILCYTHDDVVMRERGWNERVLEEFRDPEVGVAGFGGALRHGAADIYKTPYRLRQLGRSGYFSNVDDAEVHGERFVDAHDVAVLDGFCLIVRRSLLDRIGGWSFVAAGCDFFNYDYAICALAHRFGYRVRCIGVRCHHHGGRTSVKEKGSPITSQGAYDKSHAWFYQEFRDVLPWECK